MKKTVFPLCLALIIASSFFLLLKPTHHEPESAVFPPLILINNIYYKSSGHCYELLPNGSVYLGNIQSTVPSTKLPEESFQANDDIEGAQIYHIDDQLFVLIN